MPATLFIPPSVIKDQQDSPDLGKEIASRRATVARWNDRIVKAKAKWEGDFKRMKFCMDFAAGCQWADQKSIDSNDYINNLVIAQVNNKVAQLYARDPKTIARRRKRLDFALWDENMDSLMFAVGELQLAQQGSTSPGLLGSMAVINDYQIGMQQRALYDKIAKTLEVVYQWQIDQQEPEFKAQMKALVRRVITTGVGYVKLSFERDYETAPSSTETQRLISSRIQRAKAILSNLEEQALDESSEHYTTLQMLFQSVGVSGADLDIKERLVFDFPPSTSIIPDPRCRSLKGWIGARWLCQEYILPRDEVEAFFEVKLSTSTKEYSLSGEQKDSPQQPNQTLSQDPASVSVCVREVFDITTHSHFYICDGYSDFLLGPEEVEPKINRFWPIFALTFNDIEVEEGCKATIFPPSDVFLLKHPQKEINRSRNELRKHRIHNRPRWMSAGSIDLSDEDIDKIQDAESGDVVKLKGVLPETDIAKVFTRFPTAPVDPALYDVGPMIQDVQFATKTQEANMGPAPKNITATAATISEQSRISSASSNVDDLDDFLSDLSKAGGEMLLREMSRDTVERIAGRGAVWPINQRQDFLNEINLEVQAASSGRPNSAIEVSKWERVAPVLLQAGANPQFMVRETLKRFDERIDTADAFPLQSLLKPGVASQPVSSSTGQSPSTTLPEPVEAPPQQSVQQPTTTI